MGMDHYTKVKDLGGTSGAFLAYDKQNPSRRVVIKRLADGSQGMEELNASLRVQHDHIIELQESFVHNGALYVVVRYESGGDLDSFLSRLVQLKKLPKNRTLLSWFAQLLTAVQYCHEQKILHRDIKPGNIFMSEDTRQLYLGDFGSAKALRTESMTTTFVGSPMWISPEVLMGTPYGYASDIWSLGCVFYEMASLTRPFSSSSFARLVQQITSGKITALPETVTPEIRAIVHSMIVLDPQARPTAAALLERVQISLEEEGRRHQPADEQEAVVVHRRPIAANGASPVAAAVSPSSDALKGRSPAENGGGHLSPQQKNINNNTPPPPPVRVSPVDRHPSPVSAAPPVAADKRTLTPPQPQVSAPPADASPTSEESPQQQEPWEEEEVHGRQPMLLVISCRPDKKPPKRKAKAPAKSPQKKVSPVPSAAETPPAANIRACTPVQLNVQGGGGGGGGGGQKAAVVKQRQLVMSTSLSSAESFQRPAAGRVSGEMPDGFRDGRRGSRPTVAPIVKAPPPPTHVPKRAKEAAERLSRQNSRQPMLESPQRKANSMEKRSPPSAAISRESGPAKPPLRPRDVSDARSAPSTSPSGTPPTAVLQRSSSATSSGEMRPSQWFRARNNDMSDIERYLHQFRAYDADILKSRRGSAATRSPSPGKNAVAAARPNPTPFRRQASQQADVRSQVAPPPSNYNELVRPQDKQRGKKKDAAAPMPYAREHSHQALGGSSHKQRQASEARPKMLTVEEQRQAELGRAQAREKREAERTKMKEMIAAQKAKNQNGGKKNRKIEVQIVVAEKR